MIDQIVKYTDTSIADAKDYFDKYFKYILLSKVYSYPKNKILFDLYFSIPHLSFILKLLNKITPQGYRKIIREIVMRSLNKLNKADENVNANQITLSLTSLNSEIYKLYNTKDMEMNADDRCVSFDELH